jgi:hypothetical protein
MARFLEDDDDPDPGPDRGGKPGGRRAQGGGGVLERVFGICEADPKEGREASNVIHPQSPFATGAPRPSRLARPW